MQTKKLLAWAAAWLLTCAVRAEPVALPPVELKPVRWQLLPEAVRTVYISPDGRTWYQLDSSPEGMDESELRRELERQYGQASPRIRGAAVALLEPNGRAWFYVNGGREVWGYDGARWIERKAAPASRFCGCCLTRGQLPDNLSNVSVSGRTWLRDEQGVHIFDGTDWSYTALCVPLNTIAEFPRLAVSPSGKLAVAMTPKSTGRTLFLQNPDVWIWHEGQQGWQKCPFAWGDRETAVGSFCVTDEGTLWCVHGGLLRSFSLLTGRERADRLPNLISQLDDDDPQRREEAQAKLSAVAEQIQAELQAALKTARSAEMRMRLEALLRKTRDFKVVVDIRPGGGTVVGSHRVQHAKQIFQDKNGKLYIIAEAVDGVAAGKGLLVVDPQGRSDWYGFGAQFRTIFATPTVSRGPVLTPAGDAVWMSGAIVSRQIACRFDFNARQVTAESPDSQFNVVRAVDDAGQVFLARREHYPLADASFGLGRFAPESVDPQTSLKFEAHAIAWPEFVVASDETVWAVRGDGALSRYNGVQWELIHSQKGPELTPLLAGRENVVLCRKNTDYALFQDGRLVATAPLRRLIEAYRDVFAAAFPPSFTPIQTQYRIWIAADSSRNIWLSENNRVSVFDGEDWIDTREAINAAPGRRSGGGPVFISPVDSGHKIYLSITGTSPKGESFLAQLQAGKVVLVDAPHGPTTMLMPIGLRDRDGALWVPGYIPDPGGNPLRIHGHRSVRLGADGPLQEFTNNCWPVLVDASGNVWLAEMATTAARTRFSVWRDGKIAQELEISGADYVYGMFSDRPRSVYVWTSLGLHHVVDDSQRGASRLRVDQTYSLPSLPFYAPGCTFSQRTGLVVPANTGRPSQLCFFALPNE